MALGRTHKLRRRREDAKETAERNRILKAAERKRRDARMLGKLQTASFPYSAAVMSWLSARLGKKASRITERDAKTIVG
jgi:hypothetical protein